MKKIFGILFALSFCNIIFSAEDKSKKEDEETQKLIEGSNSIYNKEYLMSLLQERTFTILNCLLYNCCKIKISSSVENISISKGTGVIKKGGNSNELIQGKFGTINSFEFTIFPTEEEYQKHVQDNAFYGAFSIAELTPYKTEIKVSDYKQLVELLNAQTVVISLNTHETGFLVTFANNNGIQLKISLGTRDIIS